MTEAEAVSAARALIVARGAEGRHHIAATVITGAGTGYTGLHLDSALGRAAICAEAVAIGLAMTAEPGAEIVFSCAVNREGRVIPPCGLCRELLLDFGPRARVAVPDGAAHAVMDLAALMPVPGKPEKRGLA